MNQEKQKLEEKKKAISFVEHSYIPSIVDENRNIKSLEDWIHKIQLFSQLVILGYKDDKTFQIDIFHK